MHSHRYSMHRYLIPLCFELFNAKRCSLWLCNESGLCGSLRSSPEVAIIGILTFTYTIHFPEALYLAVITSPAAHHYLNYLRGHFTLTLCKALFLHWLTFLSVLFSLMWIIASYLWPFALFHGLLDYACLTSLITVLSSLPCLLFIDTVCTTTIVINKSCKWILILSTPHYRRLHHNLIQQLLTVSPLKFLLRLACINNS